MVSSAESDGRGMPCWAYAYWHCDVQRRLEREQKTDERAARYSIPTYRRGVEGSFEPCSSLGEVTGHGKMLY
jgi:hypothetical protein